MPRIPKLLPVLAAALVCAAPTSALATNVMGQLASNTTWDPSGNPYNVTGDLTVPVGVTLTIQPGTQVVFASTDGMASGTNTSEVELIVKGTLAVNGSASTGVTINASAGYGVVIDAGGTATLDYTTITGGSSYYGIRSAGGLTANSATFTGGSTCVYVSGGTTTINSSTVSGCSTGVSTYGGTTNVNYSVIRNCTSYAAYLQAPANLLHNTIANNSGYGVYLEYFSGSVTIKDNAITQNGGYGLRAYSSSTPSRTVSHNDVWGNSSGDYSNVAPGTGGVSENPLYVGGTNYTPTSNSPLRLAASDGTDIGAFAYVGDPTPDLRGVLHSNLTLSGTNTVVGDLTVKSGVTLTLAPGASLTFASSDGQGSGANSNETELIVAGTLQAQGSSSSHVTLNASQAYGVRVLASGTATLDYTDVTGHSSYYGVHTAGAFTANNSSITGGGTGLYVAGGTTTFNGGTISGGGYGVATYGGNTNLNYSLIKGTSSYGAYLVAPASLIHNTIANNSNYGVYLEYFSGTVTLKDNAITHNGSYGVRAYSSSTPSRTVSHNDVWGNSSGDYYNVSPGTGAISQNPIYVGGSNYSPTTNSPLRLAASDGTDIGAFAHLGDPTPDLRGVLYTNQTLTGAHTITGDLTVKSGVTLTLAPGASITFASSDAQGSGANTNETELIVEGTLQSQGSSSTHVTLNASQAYGVRVLASGTATLDYTDLTGHSSYYGVHTAGTFTANNSTITGAGTGLYVAGGTTSFNGGTISGGGYGVATYGGNTGINYSLIKGTSSYGAYLVAPTSLIHNTIANNSNYGVYLESFSGTVTLKDNAITQNGSYGVRAYSSSSPSRTATYNDVWGNSSGDYYNVNPGTGSFSQNPIYVGGTNYKPTTNSPLRMAASDGTDIGAFAWTGDPTPDLRGVLYTNQTLTGANTVTGDLTVRSGVTLTLAAGATLTFASSDAQGSGANTNETELIVAGTLQSQGSASSHVTLSAGQAYGVRVLSGGNATLDYTDVTAHSSYYGVHTAGTFTANNSSISGGGTGLYVAGGTATFNSGTLSGGGYGVATYGGNTSINYSLIKGTSSYGAYLVAPSSLIHNTIANNSSYGVYLESFTGSVTLKDNIITDNGSYGIRAYSSSSPSRSISYNDVWNNSSGNLFNVSGGTGALSTNPVYVSPGFNYTLQSTSPCRNAASDGTDMGAFPYTPVPVSYVTVTPASPSLAINGTQQFTATAYDALNNPLPGTPFTWSASSSAGTVSSSGLFTAGCTPGTYAGAVTATASGKSASATVTINTGPVATVTVAPSTATLQPNGTQQFNATVKDACNNTLTDPVSWLVVAGGGSISTSGLFTAGSTPGTFTNTVRAMSGSISGSATVTVQSAAVATVEVTPVTSTLSINGTQQFTAVAKDAMGNTIPTSFTWAVVAGGGSINSTGFFTAGTTPGTFTNTVRATSGSISGYATVTVNPGALASITLTPPSASLPVSGAQQFQAVGKDSAGNTVAFTPTWSVVAGGGTINSGGLFTAGTTPGTFTNTVRASNATGTISGHATVTVNAGALASIDVTPLTSTVTVNGTQQFTATGKDASGNTIPVSVTWSVVNGGGSISPTGLFTAGTTPGTFTNTIRATSGTVTGSASVTVNVGALATIEVAPSTASLAINGTQQFSATGKDSAGNTVPVTVTWSVVNGGGTVSTGGLFTAGTTPGTFTNTVRATSGTVSGYATVTVTPGALASIEVAPSTASVTIGGTQQFTATGKDAAGNTVPATVTWSVVAGGGTINPSGLFTAGTAPGTFTNTVKATSGSISGFASVTVQPGAATSISVAPAAATIGIGGQQQFTASGQDSAGNTVPVSVTWSVVAGGGSISPSGLFTAGTTPGTFTNTVKATSGSLTAFATVTVQAGALASLQITPASSNVVVNGTKQFTVTGKDSAGNTVPVTVTWVVANGGGTIDQTGLFTAGNVAGTFTNTVKASTSGGNTAFASVDVTPGPVNTVEIAPNSSTIAVRKTQKFTVTAKDAFGNTVSGTPAWTLSPASVGTIDQTGLLTAGGIAGTYPAAIEATVNGVTGTADLTLTPGPLAKVSVSPLNPTVAAGGTLQFNAAGEDADGNLVSITPAWSVLNGAGTITQTGAFTAAQTPGSYVDSVRAIANGIPGTASVTVTAASITRVAISPENPLIAVQGTVQFTARAYDAFNNEVFGLTPAWEVVNGGGTIDASGLFTAGETSGDYDGTIQASLGGQTATTSVEVATDFDQDGLPDEWELAHGLDPNDDADATLDPDADGLPNAGELTATTDPHDADSDDDGVVDGLELRPTEDLDGDGLVSGLDADSDGDGLFDGTEMAVSTAHADTDLAKASFVADADPATSTDPMNPNTDGDARADGEEDLDHNGRIDEGETDPNTPNTFCDSDEACGAADQCVQSVCVPRPDDVPGPKTGCGCGAADGSGSTALLALGLLGLGYALRPRRARVTLRSSHRE